MIEFVLLCAAVGTGTIAALFAFLAFLRAGSRSRREQLTPQLVAQIVRAESEIIRTAGENHARGLRQDVAGSWRTFQEALIGAIRTLNEFMRTEIKDFGGRLDTGTATIDKRVEGIATKLNDDLGRMTTESHGHRDALRQVVEAKLDDATAKQDTSAAQLRQELEESFKRLGDRVNEALQQASEHQKERLDKTATALTALSEKQEHAQDKLRDSVEGRLDSIRRENVAKLDEMRQVVDEKLQSTLESRLGESFNRVVEQLRSVQDGIGEMKKLAANVGDLQKVLTNVKIRGTYGEVQIAVLLDEFLSSEQYIKDAVTGDNTAERVEYAIRLPGRDRGGEVLLPIDAKFPREDYENLLAASEAGDQKLVAHFRRQLEQRIKACAKDIRDKFISPPRTTDFGILFIPTESLYAEILRQPGLFESVQHEHHVTLASPTTLAAMLNAFQMGFRSVAIERRSSEVWQVLGAVRTEFKKYNDVVETLGKQLNRAANSVDSLGRRTRAMTRTLRTVEALPDDTATQKLLGISPAELAEEDAELDSVDEVPSQPLVPGE
jgi:DNA recombination protein RmuC